MPNPENVRPYQFKKGQSGNPNGRPKNRVTGQWLPELFGKRRAKAIASLTPEEVDSWERKLLVATSGELAQIAKWDAAPAYAKNLAIAILYDTKNGRTSVIDKLRERQYGAATQRIEITSAQETDRDALERELERLRTLAAEESKK